MTDLSVRIVEEETRELVRRRGIDPAREGCEPVARLVDEVIDDYVTRPMSGICR